MVFKKNKTKHLGLFFSGLIFFPTPVFSFVGIDCLGSKGLDFRKPFSFVESYTSIRLKKEISCEINPEDLKYEEGVLWVYKSLVWNEKDKLKLARWIKRGGFLVWEGGPEEAFTEGYFQGQGQWGEILPDHEIMRGFYLLASLPSCLPEGTHITESPWKVYTFEGRSAILKAPPGFFEGLSQPAKNYCPGSTEEASLRAFTNILLVSLTMDYKKDQIHMKEILKRLP